MSGISVRVYGLKETIRHLQRYDKEMYEQIKVKFTTAAKPLADKIGQEFPDKPLKNWHTRGGRKGKSRMPPYSGTSARRGVKPVLSLSGRRSKAATERQEVGILRIQQMNAGGQVFDTAGSKKSSRFVKNLDKHYQRKSVQGKYRSRLLYALVENNIHDIESNVAEAVGVTDKLISARIAGEGL